MNINALFIIFFLGPFFLCSVTAKKPNILLIVCDDLNDYIETLGGHPQAKTPNITKLINSGVSFTQAHCNIPICNPSRASFVTVFTHITPNSSVFQIGIKMRFFKTLTP
jgi:hypothetical protein